MAVDTVQVARQAMESPAVFDLLKKDDTAFASFAGAFCVPMEIFRAAFDEKVAANAAADAAASRGKRIAAKMVAFEAFKEVIEAEHISFNTDVQALWARIGDFIDSMSDEDGVVDVDVSLVDDGIGLHLQLSSDSFVDSKKGRSGPRTKYDYFFDGAAIEGRLKGFILDSFPSSAAAATIRDHDPKTGTKKGAISSFDAVQADESLAARFTRVAK